MVGWEKPVTIYHKNNNKKNNLDCHKECSTYVCWRSRLAKREREEEFDVSEVAPAASLLLRSLALSSVHTVLLFNDLYQYQITTVSTTIFTIISASCTTIFTKRFRSTYIH